MLGWGKYQQSDQQASSPDTGLIDHIATAAARESRLTWDGRKGQWVPVTYTYTFPRDVFDQITRTGEANFSEIAPRPLAKFTFPPSQRHAVMLDPGSPRLRIFPRAILSSGRKPELLNGIRNVQHSPLSRPTLYQHRQPPRHKDLASLKTNIRDMTEDTEDEEHFDEPTNPFNLEPRGPPRPISWLDDIDIEDFLSSAIDYHHTDGSPSTCPSSSKTANNVNSSSNFNSASNVMTTEIPMSEPVYPMFRKRSRKCIPPSPCTPSSPPPPLFSDDINRPIPYFRPGLTHE